MYPNAMDIVAHLANASQKIEFATKNPIVAMAAMKQSNCARPKISACHTSFSVEMLAVYPNRNSATKVRV